MGNSQSDTRTMYSTRSHVPSHLKPIKNKKKDIRQKSANVAKDEVEQKKQETLEKPLPPILNIPAVVVNGTENAEFADELASYAGSGPRGAFHWFKGRRYINHDNDNGLDKNLLPNDQMELDRQRVLSFIIRWAFRGDISAPIESGLRKGLKALNVGYGPGMWTGHHIIDMALDHPRSQFTVADVCDLLPPDFEETNTIKSGTSSSISTTPSLRHKNKTFTPVHPKLSKKLQTTGKNPSAEDTTSYSDTQSRLSHADDATSISTCSEVHDETISRTDHLSKSSTIAVSRKILPNLDFYEADVLNAELPFEDDQFDFVQLRLVTAIFTLSDWQKAMKEVIRVTKPGGYIQLLEIDYYTFNLGRNGRQWKQNFIGAIRKKRNMEPRMACHLSDLLKAIGAVEVSSKLVSIPCGSWGLDLGILWKNNMESFAESTAPLFSKLLGCTTAEYLANWRILREEADKERCFTNFHSAWGRKPAGYDSETAVNWSLCPPFCKNP